MPLIRSLGKLSSAMLRQHRFGNELKVEERRRCSARTVGLEQFFQGSSAIQTQVRLRRESKASLPIDVNSGPCR